MQGQCNVRVVVVGETSTNRSAVLFSTDINLAAARLYRYDNARVQIEFLFRDAKQFTGLTDCQARSQAKLAFHCTINDQFPGNQGRIVESGEVVEDGVNRRLKFKV